MIYEYECKCGWSGDISCTVDERDSQLCPSCSKKPNRVFSTPKLALWGGRGDSMRLPETLAEEQALLQKKAIDEKTFGGNANGVKSGEHYTWVPGKGVPERFQPKLK